MPTYLFIIAANLPGECDGPMNLCFVVTCASTIAGSIACRRFPAPAAAAAGGLQ